MTTQSVGVSGTVSASRPLIAIPARFSDEATALRHRAEVTARALADLRHGAHCLAAGRRINLVDRRAARGGQHRQHRFGIGTDVRHGETPQSCRYRHGYSWQE